MQTITAITVMLVLLSILISMPRVMMGHKLDPLLLIRPIGRWFMRLPARNFRNASNLLYRWGRQLWNYRPGHWGQWRDVHVKTRNNPIEIQGE